MKNEILLEWRYEPKNCIEEPYPIQEVDYVIDIDNGTAKVILDFKYENDRNIIEKIRHRLEKEIQIIQLLIDKPCKLIDYEPRETWYHADGRIERIISTNANLDTSSMSIDFLVIGEDGTIRQDTRKERLENQRLLLDLINKHIDRDATLEAIIKSYSAALKDPENEFIHLYEIRDALKKCFENEKEDASKKLNIKKEWKKIGKLANEPLRQSRHRGNFVGKLRDATPEELTEARQIAKAMIQSYVNYLDEQANASSQL